MRHALIAVSILTLLAACTRPRDPVEALLFDITAAAGERNADRIVERLSSGFAGEAGLTRDAALAELRRHFFLYKGVEVVISDVATEGPSDSLTVRCRAHFSGTPKDVGGLAGLLPDAASYRFELSLTQEAGVLKIARASWQREELPAP